MVHTKSEETFQIEMKLNEPNQQVYYSIITENINDQEEINDTHTNNSLQLPITILPNTTLPNKYNSEKNEMVMTITQNQKRIDVNYSDDENKKDYTPYPKKRKIVECDKDLFTFLMFKTINTPKISEISKQIDYLLGLINSFMTNQMIYRKFKICLAKIKLYDELLKIATIQNSLKEWAKCFNLYELEVDEININEDDVKQIQQVFQNNGFCDIKSIDIAVIPVNAMNDKPFFFLICLLHYNSENNIQTTNFIPIITEINRKHIGLGKPFKEYTTLIQKSLLIAQYKQIECIPRYQYDFYWTKKLKNKPKTNQRMSTLYTLNLLFKILSKMLALPKIDSYACIIKVIETVTWDDIHDISAFKQIIEKLNE